jgi:hypothetical protein
MDLSKEPVMAARATVQPNKYLNAHARIEIEGMRQTIMTFLNDKILADMAPAVDEVVRRVLDEGHWKTIIETEVRRGLEGLFTECVKDAIAYNYDLRQLIRGRVHKEVTEALAKVAKEQQ